MTSARHLDPDDLPRLRQFWVGHGVVNESRKLKPSIVDRL